MTKVNIYYNFLAAEKKWRQVWQILQQKQIIVSNKLFDICKYHTTTIIESENDIVKQQDISNNEAVFVLEMFPYPSGKIHMGHVLNYTIGDVIVRFLLLNGKKVLHTMGWDAFGLPAENAAKEHRIDPETWTLQNIDYMKAQLQNLSFFYNWEQSLSTCDVGYYRHQQTLFKLLYEKNLIYRKSALVNWDPIEQCVLANEQVIDGKGWRSGAIIEQKKMSQWFIKITDYADELFTSIDELKLWPEKIKIMQKNWIGKTDGWLVKLEIQSVSENSVMFNDNKTPLLFDSLHDLLSRRYIEVFFPNLEFIQESSFISITQDYADQLFPGKIQRAHEDSLLCDDGESVKTQYYVINPMTQRHIPIYISLYTNSKINVQAIAGIPSKVKQDQAFAMKNQIPMVLIDELATKEMIIKKLNELNILQKQTNYHLQDWCISRQRSWGCPIPIIYCETCGIVLSQDVVILPKNIRDKIDEAKILSADDSMKCDGNPLSLLSEWVTIKCPKCQQIAKRETDTMDTFVDSSWYFLRYISARPEKPFDYDEVKKFLPVMCYIGGVEHATSHLLYARFFNKALRDMGLLPNDRLYNEPFTQLINQGMIHHAIYKNHSDKYLYPDDVKKIHGQYYDQDNMPVTILPPEKMSKSKKNVVNPDEMMRQYGKDTINFFLLSDTPVGRDIIWSEEGLQSNWKFVNTIYRTSESIVRLMDNIIDIYETKTINKMVNNFDVAKSKIPTLHELPKDNLDNDVDNDILRQIDYFLNNVCIKTMRGNCESMFTQNILETALLNINDSAILKVNQYIQNWCQNWQRSLLFMTDMNKQNICLIINYIAEMKSLYENIMFNIAIANIHKIINTFQVLLKFQLQLLDQTDVDKNMMNANSSEIHTLLIERYMIVMSFVAFIIAITPIVPNLTEEIWSNFGGVGYTCVLQWPNFAKYNKQEKSYISVQVDGKIRAQLDVNKEMLKSEIIAQALLLVSKYIKDRHIINTIYIPKLVINFVLEK